MEVDQVRAARRALERAILNLITEFETKTTTSVAEISFVRFSDVSGTSRVASVEVKVEM